MSAASSDRNAAADGRELYYLAADGGVMAVEVTTTPGFTAGPPKLLFRVPGTFRIAETGYPGCTVELERGSISRDGQRFAFVVAAPQERKEVAVAPGILAQYTGTYADTNVDWEVTLEGDRLMLRWVPGGPIKTPLLPESETSFFMTAQSAIYEFVKDRNGEAKYLFRYAGGAPRQFIRK